MEGDWPTPFFAPEGIWRIVDAAGGWPDSVAQGEQAVRTKDLADRLDSYVRAFALRVWNKSLLKDSSPFGPPNLSREDLLKAAQRVKGRRRERGRPPAATTALLHDLIGAAIEFFELRLNTSGRESHGPLVDFCAAVIAELQGVLDSREIIWWGEEATSALSFELALIAKPVRIRDRIRDSGLPELGTIGRPQHRSRRARARTPKKF
jgi:hypothetical protein